MEKEGNPQNIKGGIIIQRDKTCDRVGVRRLSQRKE